MRSQESVHRSAVWRSMYAAVAPYRWYVRAMGSITLLWALDDSILRPYILKLLLDRMVLPPHASSVHVFIPILLVYGVARVTISLLVRVWDWCALRLVPALKGEVVRRLMVHVLDHAYGADYYDGSGILAGSIHTAAEGAPQILIPFVGRFLGSSCRVLCAVGLLWFSVPAIAPVMTAWVLCFLCGGLWWAYRSYELADIASNSAARVTGMVVDILTNISAVQLFNRVSHEQRGLVRLIERWIATERTRDGVLLRLYLLQGLTFVLAELSVLWMVVLGYMRGTVTPGDAALVVSINMVLLEALWDIPQEVTLFVRAFGRVSQGLRIVLNHAVPRLPHARVVETPQMPHGAIRFDQVLFGYAKTAPLFKQLSFAIPARQKVGLVGYSGSGKTTLVNLILRLYVPEQGRILVDGQDINRVDIAAFREKVLFIPQDPILFHRTIAENICYGAPHATEEEMRHAAQRACIDEVIQALPDGYQTVVGERGVRLSTGQRQRILTARALLKDALLVIMDEATSALDSVTEHEVYAGMQALIESRTTIVIAHRLSTLLRMDRILVLDHGELIEDGTHAELYARGGVYRKLWDSQVGGILGNPDIGACSLGIRPTLEA